MHLVSVLCQLVNLAKQYRLSVQNLYMGQRAP